VAAEFHGYVVSVLDECELSISHPRRYTHTERCPRRALHRSALLGRWHLFLRAKYHLQNISDFLRSSCSCFDRCEHDADRVENAATIRAVSF
jgi:hypothetical protein